MTDSSQVQNEYSGWLSNNQVPLDNQKNRDLIEKTSHSIHSFLEKDILPEVFINSYEFQLIIYHKEKHELLWVESLLKLYEDSEDTLLDILKKTEEYVRAKKWEFKSISVIERLKNPEYIKYNQVDSILWKVENLVKIQKITRFYENLNQKIIPDDLYKDVISLHLPEKIDDLLSHDIQSGGSNARGVFLISGTNLVAIQKSEGSYAYSVWLPYLTSLFWNDPNIPRTYQVFKKWWHTYQVLARAQGAQMDELNPEYIEKIPQQHFDEFVRRVNLIESSWLKIDPSKSSNFFYDPEIGFSFIDLGPNYDQSTYSMFDAKTMTIALTKRKNWGDPFEAEIMERITEKLALAIQNLSKMRVS